VSDFVVTHHDRPWTLNAERSGGKRGHGHWAPTRNLTGAWRHAFYVLAMSQKPPKWEQAHIIADCRVRHPLPDTGNIYPAVKAALDGLIDAGVLPDDSAKHVLSITMRAPEKCDKGEPESMTLTVVEA
jgi:crossover junction endodeoxyribonuclease RusA